MSETAVAPQKAPIKEMVFEPDPYTKYAYVLVKKNERREADVFEIVNGRHRLYEGKEYKPLQNLLLRSSIIWDGKSEKPFGWGDFPAGRRIIRYYDGCESLFIDQQPKDKETIDQVVASTRHFWFNNGEIEILGYDKMLKLYLDICSYNSESPYRVPSVDAIFRPINPEGDAALLAKNMDYLEEALKKAKEAPLDKVRLHAYFLGVPSLDLMTNRELTETALRAAYRKKAAENPQYFLDTYGNKSVELKYWIEKAIEQSHISFSAVPGTASWKSSREVICDVSGFGSDAGKVERLIEFASTMDGEKFASQLKAMYGGEVSN